MKGRKDSFYPVDQRQELSNKNIRVRIYNGLGLFLMRIYEYGPPPQGGTTWEDYEKRSPIIPLLADVVEHVETRVRIF